MDFNIIMEFLTIRTVLIIAAGSFLGMLVGAIPGLTVTMATALLVSLTYPWHIYDAMALIMGVFVSGVYSGSISAVLLNIPGAPSAIATTFDGYPLAQKGRAGEALALCAAQAFTGTLIGFLFLVVLAPLISSIALGFGTFEYFLLAIFGLLIIGTLNTENAYKGVIAGLLGITIGMIGMDPIYGVDRFTFDNIYMKGGIHFIPVLIGVFGAAEIFEQFAQTTIKKSPISFTKLNISFKYLLKKFPITFRASVIGTFIGALPGVGGDIASLVAYGDAKKSIKNSEVPFGSGSREGILAPEAAHSSCIGGALVPMLTLGIPGDSTTAIILGAFAIHGLRTGPLFMTENPEMFGIILIGGIIAATFILIYGLSMSKLFAKVITIKKEILFPAILLICVVGSYSVEKNIFHVYVMLIFGIIGYFMRITGFPTGPLILGIILGPIADSNLRRSLLFVNGSITGFIVQIVTNPISLVLLIAILWFALRGTKSYDNFITTIKYKLFQKESEV